MLANLVYYTTTVLHLGGLQILTVANTLAYNTLRTNLRPKFCGKIILSERLYYKTFYTHNQFRTEVS